ncbi:acyl-CoA thioesterase [Kushneria phosphatilytica]|uniref:Acyl-CoA thioesterase n=1 Tax=Kushneria phosphatilytica TaxID=657387 RepID=A0A1S1NWX3_9GAMM|nr:acyl-CoA thioesterase [Kushneria phosphatilytica]OHV11927.1 acyl-CoA thioesterase [Kushneria phosphatilytica]QEL11109.1 acyl-CoA thioesterase [Kushneria phosphatilytica]
MSQTHEASHEITLRFLAEPNEVNFGGKVHGGTVMRWIDHAGYTCASGWSGHYCVTIYVSGIRFLSPIAIGDLVDVHAQLLYTGRSSMHIGVDVRARNPRGAKSRLTTHCIVVFVALDESGNKVEVPHWEPGTEREKAMQAYAMRLIELRETIQEEMSEFLTDDSGIVPGN